MLLAESPNNRSQRCKLAQSAEAILYNSQQNRTAQLETEDSARQTWNVAKH